MLPQLLKLAEDDFLLAFALAVSVDPELSNCAQTQNIKAALLSHAISKATFFYSQQPPSPTPRPSQGLHDRIEKPVPPPQNSPDVAKKYINASIKLGCAAAIAQIIDRLVEASSGSDTDSHDCAHQVMLPLVVSCIRLGDAVPVEHFRRLQGQAVEAYLGWVERNAAKFVGRDAGSLIKATLVNGDATVFQSKYVCMPSCLR
ncbi:hypothetical protein BDV98DRAFT_268431 [Pterulicium gracile]|uniref:Uncharacterized protein n=1 Tax=Pterulicium gracile TaxID=1884261 RepID=A0A5C3Q5H2_9AGAR|nr:hypothetical protein BDV98DRAFT_268431 [Pterula gracilis]